MAVDPTFNDTDSSSDDSKDAPSSSVGGASSAPKPPRPARRPGAFARVPMPDQLHPPSSALPSSEEDAAPPSPASGVPDLDSSPAFPLTAHRAKARNDDSAPPVRAFSSAPSDLAPSPPVTPWNDVPAMVSAPPVRAEADASDSSPPVGVDPEDDVRDEAEQTIVGQVPRRLLELSSGDENTRAYTAPQELIELARRKREERLKAKAVSIPTEENFRETERPPARRRPLESIPEESFEGVMPGDDDESARAGSSFEADAAPAIDRPSSGPPPERKSSLAPVPEGSTSSAPRTPVSSPPRSTSSSSAAPSTPISLVPKPAGSAAPPVENSMIDRIHGAAPSDARVRQSSEPAPESAVPSAPKSSRASGARTWIIVIGLFIALGIVLARWRGLERFFLH